VLRGDDLGRAGRRQIEQVGFDDVELGKDDVVGCVEDGADRVQSRASPNEEVEVAQEALVLRARRGCHVVLPVDQLVPLPIVGEEQEVVVGELHAWAGRFTSSLPGMGSL
jgi:hypothetical protein